MALAVACNLSDIQACCICLPNLVWLLLNRSVLPSGFEQPVTLMATLTAPVSDFAARLIFQCLAALDCHIFRILILVVRRK